MKYLKPYLENNNIKKYYPFEKIERIFNWFRKEYYEIIRQEGWLLYNTGSGEYLKNWDSDTNRVFIVGHSFVGKLSRPECFIKAEHFGFILDDDGVIYDFDINKFNENKHLLAGKQLGLLENNDTRPIYPYNKLAPIYKWFNDNYSNKIYKEGWVLRISSAHFDLKKWNENVLSEKVFIVESTYSSNNDRGYPLSEQEAYQLAKKNGFIINEEGVVIDFDANEYNKIKHLLIGYALGLLESKKLYPIAKLNKLVRWFVEKFRYIISNEGWGIVLEAGHRYAYDGYDVFQITTLESISYEKAIEMAREYGWKIHDDGVIYDFDENIFKKNKQYLLTGKEMGLL